MSMKSYSKAFSDTGLNSETMKGQRNFGQKYSKESKPAQSLSPENPRKGRVIKRHWCSGQSICRSKSHFSIPETMGCKPELMPLCPKPINSRAEKCLQTSFESPAIALVHPRSKPIPEFLHTELVIRMKIVCNFQTRTFTHNLSEYFPTVLKFIVSRDECRRGSFPPYFLQYFLHFCVIA